MFHIFKYLWITTKGYRWRPWKSPYLRWRIETYSGIPASQVTFKVFCKFILAHRKELIHFLQWVRTMEEMRNRG